MQQNVAAFIDWKKVLDKKRKESGYYKPALKKVRPGYHPALEYNEDND